MIHISRIFYFQIIREVLNSGASICVVGHFRRSKDVVHIIAANFWRADFNWQSNVISFISLNIH